MSSYTSPQLQHPIPRAPFHPPQPTLDQSPPASAYGAHLPPDQSGFQRYSSPPVNLQGQQQQQQQQHQQQASSGSYGHSPYGYPQQQQQQQQQQHQPLGNMSSQQQQGGPGGGAPLWGINDATTQMGMQFGKSAVAAGHDYMEKTFTRHLPVPLLKHSFAVTNGYVIRKLGVLLWPWRHGKWARSVRRAQEGGQSEGWLPPRDDINAPDLYIPTMALVTYTLLSTITHGLRSAFRPELLGVTASKALGVVLLEFIAIKLGTYLLDVRGGATGVSGSLEMAMYGGYKFVGIILVLLVNLLNPGRLVWWAVFLYTVAANAFFLLRSLKYVVLPDPSSSPVSVSANTSHTITHAQRTTRVRFLIFVAVAQVFLMGLLVWV